MEEIIALVTVFGIMIGLSLLRRHLRKVKEKADKQTERINDVARATDNNTDRCRRRYLR